MIRSVALLVLCSAFSCGCAVHELQKDQDKIRAALLDLYTNQIMDNLIRAHNKMPIIQVDYANATATVTAKQSSSLSDMVPITNTSVFTKAATSMLVITNSTVNTLTGGGGIDHTNQVAVVASPVTASDEVYDAYETFLAINGSLQVTCEAPPPGAAHLCKRYCKMYYWVPTGFEREFLRLSLTTTAQRGTPSTPADPFYSVNFTQVLQQEMIPNSGNFWLTIKIDKKIPIDGGVADISSSSKSAQQPGQNDSAGKQKEVAPHPAVVPPVATPVPKTPTPVGTGIVVDETKTTQALGAAQTGTLAIIPIDTGNKQDGRTQTTDQLRVLFLGATPPTGYKTPLAFSSAVNSQPMPAKIYLYHHRPQTPTPSDANSRIEFYLQQIQQGQLRGVGNP